MATGSLAVSALKQLLDADPKRAAIWCESVDSQKAAALLSALPEASLQLCFRHLNPSFAGQVLAGMRPQRASSLLEGLDEQIAAEAFRTMENGARLAVLDSLSPSRKQALQEHLSYPEDSAGRLMKTDFAAFPQGMKVRDVIGRLRAAVKKGSPPAYAYVVGDDRKLKGVLVMRDLLFADPGAPIESTMAIGVKAVSAFTDREELVQLAQDRRYLAVPVVDAEGRILGSVRMAELLESSQEEASEDLQLIFGVGADEKPFSPISFKVRQRLPWLQVNLMTAFMAGAVVALFEDLITKLAVLAVFLPIIAGQAGNAGTQTMAVILRGLIMREIKPRDAWRAIGTEMGVGAINGVFTGVVTAVVAWLWKGNPFLGLVVGLAMIVNLVVAGAAGAAIPLAMKRLGFDPAQSSGIILTTVTDVVGFFAFLGLAAIFQARLVG
ncbi:MAG: magnesium transporter [Elusimicrobiota bacterium]